MKEAKEKQKEKNERGGEKMKNNGKRKYQKGITLIALVITIIVLLILAAVSIATLTGENGILSKANTAKEETQREDAKEQAKLDIADYVTEDLANGGDGSITNEKIQEILTGKDYVQEAESDYFISKDNQKIEYVELYGKIGDTGETGGSLPTTEETTPYLPSSDFSQKKGTTLETGLVIADSKGNSYVWIEVPKTETVYATAKLGITEFTETEYGKIETDLKNYASAYRDSSYKDEWYAKDASGTLVTESTATSDDLKQLKTGCGLSLSEYKELKEKMLKSVYENGGFWIGQYEMGIADNPRTGSSDSNLPTPVCKEGAYPYNWVTCKQAQEKASSMKHEDYESSLMFGIQWDLVMKHIETKNKNGKTYDELKSNSTSWGNYSDAEFTVTKGKYSTNNGASFTDVTEAEEQPYTKPKNTSVLLTTGAEVEENGNKRKE